MEFYKDYAGALFSGLLLFGGAGYISPDLIQGAILGFFIIMIVSTLLWRIVVNRRKDIYFLAIFGAIYFLFSVINYNKGGVMGYMGASLYLSFAIISVRQALTQIADERDY
ncbi:MAG: hypothetical protein WC438_00060 [Candidatus Pacearchaeota archaeon]